MHEIRIFHRVNFQIACPVVMAGCLAKSGLRISGLSPPYPRSVRGLLLYLLLPTGLAGLLAWIGLEISNFFGVDCDISVCVPERACE